MKAIIDDEGRIVLNKDQQSELGVQPGDEVVLEKQGSSWVIKPANSNIGLSHEGNVLVHRGTSAANMDPVEAARDERMEELSQGLSS